MRIGIDLDGVVLDTEKQFRNDAELYDILVLNKNSMKDPTELRVQERYDWTKEEGEVFVKSYFLEATKKSHIMPGAKEVIELLKKDGHELIVITARGMDTPLMRKLGEKMLDEAGIKFDKYYWGKKEKVEIEPFIPNGKRKCSGCGEIIDDSNVFCPKCGAKKEEVVEATEENKETDEIPETAENSKVVEEIAETTEKNEEAEKVEKVVEETIPEGKRKCSGCGEIIDDADIFCANCGTKKEETEENK